MENTSKKKKKEAEMLPAVNKTEMESYNRVEVSKFQLRDVKTEL